MVLKASIWLISIKLGNPSFFLTKTIEYVSIRLTRGYIMKKGLGKLLIAFIAFISTVSIIAAAPSSGTYTRRDLQGVTIQSGASTYYQSITFGNSTIPVYGLNKSLDVPFSGATYFNKQEITSNSFAYILSNGFGGTWNTSLLGSDLTNDQRYYATQLALWLDQGRITESSLNQNDKAVSAAIKLYRAARGSASLRPSISMSATNNEMTIDGSYYRSQLMTVSGAGYDNYTVSLSNAGSYAEIVTASGQVYNSGVSLSAGTRFYVRIPVSRVSSSMTPLVNISAAARDPRVYQYSTNNASYQDMAVLQITSTTVTSQYNLSLRYEQRSSVVVSKKDTATNRELAGATLVLTDANNRTVETWVSTTTPKTISNLPAGRYTISEMYAPSGYQLASPVSFTLVAGEVRPITVYNTTIAQRGTINVSATNSSTNQILSGVTMVLKDANGNTIETWTSTTSAKSMNLPVGRYTLTQTRVPSGYTLNTNPVNITIAANDSKAVYMPVTPVSKATLVVSNIDMTSKREISGTTLVLKDANGRTVETWISNGTPRTITNLEPGRYTVTQTRVPNDYNLNTEVHSVTVVSGETRTVTVQNAVKTHGVGIVTLDNVTKQPLRGITVVLKDIDGKTIETWVSTNEPHVINGLVPGAYSITQTRVPAGYILNSQTIYFTITSDSDSNRVISINSNPDTQVSANKVQISVRNTANNQLLAGANLVLKNARGEVVDSWISTNEIRSIVLTQGTYTLIQIQAPGGYELSDEIITFNVDANGNADRPVVIYNSIIPRTADIDLTTIYAGFAGTIALGLFGMFKLSKQQY